MFLILFVSLNLFPHIHYYNSVLLTESLAISMLIFSIYFFYSSLESSSKIILFFSGLFFIISVFLRPFLAPIIILFLFTLICKFKKSKILFYVVIFCTPIVICLGSWTARNYFRTNQLIPLASTLKWSTNSNYAFRTFRNLNSDFGFSNLYWQKDSPLFWFVNSDSTNQINNVSIKDYFDVDNKYLSKFQVAKHFFELSNNKNIDLEDRKNYEKLSSLILIKIHDSLDLNFIEKNILNRLKYTYKFLNQPSENPFKYIQNNLWLSSWNVLNYFHFKLIVVLGLVSIILYFNQFLKVNFLISYFIPIFIIVLFPVIFKTYEYRGLVIAIPFLQLSASYLISKKIKQILN